MDTSHSRLVALLALSLGGSSACLLHALGIRARGEVEVRLATGQIAAAQARVASLARFSDDALRLARERSAASRVSFATIRAALKAMPKNWVVLGPEQGREGPVLVGCAGMPAGDWAILVSDLRLIAGYVPHVPIRLEISEVGQVMNEPRLAARVSLGESVP